MLATDKRKKSLNISVVPTKISPPDDQPCSPAESTASFMSSISGIAEKSASELGTLLKGAYKSLKEKEKNLLLAAEVGKSLLEHNQNLKSDYDTLLKKIRSCDEQVKRKCEDDDSTMQLLCSKNSYESMIESLETMNDEMQQTLVQTQQEAHSTNQANLQKQRKLEQEIQVLKDTLDIATQKVQDLEDQNKFQQQRVRQLDNKQRQHADLKLLEELTTQMELLFCENQQLQSSKKSVEQKLVRSLHDLERLRHDFENFQLSQQNYEALQDAFDRQKLHIRELNDSLEEHRVILSQLRTPSHQSVFSTCQSKQSLMGELENAWCKTKPASKTDSLFSFCNAPADYAIDTILSTCGIESSIIQETTRFLKSYDMFEPDNSDYYAECNIYPQLLQKDMECKPTKGGGGGLLNLIQMRIRYLFSSLFQWCRFAIVLATAVLINLWKGPRLLMHK